MTQENEKLICTCGGEMWQSAGDKEENFLICHKCDKAWEFKSVWREHPREAQLKSIIRDLRYCIHEMNRSSQWALDKINIPK
jgi:hypothetical protein